MIAPSFPSRFFAPLLAILAVLSTVATAADPWPGFRGPGGDGVGPERADLPVDWSAAEHVRWRTELEGNGWSSPVIGEDRVYVTAAIPRGGDAAQGYDLSLLGLDRESGKILEEVKIFEQSAEQSQSVHNKNSHASPTALLTPDRIFAHFGYQGTAALDRDGNILWSNRELNFPPVHGNGGSPVLVDGLLIFTCDGADDAFIAALRAEDGKLAWRVPRPVDSERKFSFCTPTVIDVAGETQVIVPGSDCVMAVDPQDGHTLWIVRYDGYSVVPKPVYADSLVFVATGFGSPQILAIDPKGRGDITDSGIKWSLDRGAPQTPSPLAHKGLLYVLSDDGVLTVVRTQDGEQVYRKRLGGNYSASPVLAGDRLYLTSEEGTTSVVRAGEKFDLLGENELHERTLASPAVADDALFLRTEKALYRIED